MKNIEVLLAFLAILFYPSLYACEEKLESLYLSYLDAEVSENNPTKITDIKHAISKTLSTCTSGELYFISQNRIFTKPSYITYIELAMISGDLDLFHKYLNINAQTPKHIKSAYTSPLFLSAQLGNIYFIETLITHGYNINQLNEYGYTPIVESTSLEALEVFLSNKADLNFKGKNGESIGCTLLTHTNRDIVARVKPLITEVCSE
jgi:hypothetical protein